MIKLTFKNVDQGDSILLEWKKDGANKIAVVDCNRAFNSNPVLEHIKKSGYKRIDLMILSHPHSDHLSGFSELIQYCIDNEVYIGFFLHTANNTANFWNYSFTNGKSRNEAKKLFELLRVARDKIGLRHHPIHGESAFLPIEIGDHFKLKILSPISESIDKFVNERIITAHEEESGNHPSANWLSTLLKIYTDDSWFILLTSDIPVDTFVYYGTRKNVRKNSAICKDEFSGKLILGQSSHHGSKLNHKNSFWKNLKRNDHTPIVFSVGRNTYNHPAKEVVDFFQKNKFKIFSTNAVGPFSTNSVVAKTASTHLQTFGTRIPKTNTDFEGDKIFEIDASGNLNKI